MTSTPTVLPAGLARIRQQMGPYVPGQLSTGEKFWRDHFRWLHERGYKLRPRYHPNWEPSWKKEGRKDNTYVDVDKYADGISLTYVTAIDAVRLRDNRQVYLKRVFWNTHPHEVTISQLFSNSRMQADARNHCVPISETLDLPEGNGSILVMPFLRPFDDPPFLTVGEAIDCIQQLFEGIAFMHEKGYAHRDCTANNIMFDPREIFPRLYHPVKIHRNMELTGSAKYSTRTLHPPRYYFIDLGLTGYYGSPTHPPLVDQIWGGDKTVPEFQRSSNPCDPFATDVYYIGNVVRTRLLQRYKGLEFLESLVARMVDGAPQKRPLMSAITFKTGEI
ncbi:hypothetical protein PUNSTDRAFT_137215 [Punctularia strigosozonata HHB-11173 SS5]|uniref:uncharacterized protein n=1 Tax=Punctularia strigosozonata (strain HHB-11173) TaxID=741275 RepID=UPI00044185E3|nr:uncharacterized protein PUNSTDRAFT_137215 [Punctularia strigosozonata HHB-11173 SS5]EIN05722.1 hypothetical protein PUNSTDRAFT_137215 [Punctularia strigosozonata HHB-11173 SS5]